MIFTNFIGIFLSLQASAYASESGLSSDVIFHRVTEAEISNLFANPHTFQDLPDCRANIARIVCLVDPLEDPTDESERPCLAGSSDYAGHFERHFDRSEPVIQRMYCHLQRIWVEKQFFGTAYAAPIITESGTMVGAGIGIRREVLDVRPDLAEWISWKEETSFGGSSKTTDPRLGIINYRLNRTSPDDFLDYVLSHEFGHLFDFANALNRLDDCRWEETSPGNWEPVGSCTIPAGSWGAFSWAKLGSPRPESDYPLRSRVCFYNCPDGFLDPAEAGDLFASLIGTDFVSVYASTNFADDWAESFAQYLFHERSAFNIGVETGGRYFDLSGHYYSPKMAAKLEYIRNFLAGSPKYPGE
jgi:hypothetical protein